jgi:hypothetical protein
LSCQSLQFCNDSRIPAGLTAPKAFGVAEVEKPQSGGADCGYPFIRLTDTVSGAKRKGEIGKRRASTSPFSAALRTHGDRKALNSARNGVSPPSRDFPKFSLANDCNSVMIGANSNLNLNFCHA